MSADGKIGYGLTESDLYDIFGCLVDWSSGFISPDDLDNRLMEALISKFKTINKETLVKIFNKWSDPDYTIEQIVMDVKSKNL